MALYRIRTRITHGIGVQVTHSGARVGERHFRKICVEQELCGCWISAIDRIFYAFTSSNPQSGNTVSFSEWLDGFSALFSGRGMGFDNDKKVTGYGPLSQYSVSRCRM